MGNRAVGIRQLCLDGHERRHRSVGRKAEVDRFSKNGNDLLRENPAELVDDVQGKGPLVAIVGSYRHRPDDGIARFPRFALQLKI